MEFIIAIAVVVAVIFGIFVFFPFSLEKGTRKNKSSEKIIRSFEPDNIAPELTEMIQYHKEHGITKYEL